MNAVTVRADEILRALAKNHTEQAFFTEVKTGPTWYNTDLQRLDAVAVKKSWTRPCVDGFEVKVARSDFLHDTKWPGYRDYCHRLYFVCPSGLIQAEELAADVGLVWYNPKTQGLVTRKAAIFRSIEVPGEMFYYLVLSRAGSDRHPFFSSTREMLEAWVTDKSDRLTLGLDVQSKLVREYKEAIMKAAALEGQLEALQGTAEKWKRFRQLAKELGIMGWGWHWEEEWEERLRRAVGGSVASDKVIAALNRITIAAAEIRETLGENQPKDGVA